MPQNDGFKLYFSENYPKVKLYTGKTCFCRFWGRALPHPRLLHHHQKLRNLKMKTIIWYFLSPTYYCSILFPGFQTPPQASIKWMTPIYRRWSEETHLFPFLAFVFFIIYKYIKEIWLIFISMKCIFFFSKPLTVNFLCENCLISYLNRMV